MIVLYYFMSNHPVCQGYKKHKSYILYSVTYNCHKFPYITVYESYNMTNSPFYVHKCLILAFKEFI